MTGMITAGISMESLRMSLIGNGWRSMTASGLLNGGWIFSGSRVYAGVAQMDRVSAF